MGLDAAARVGGRLGFPLLSPQILSPESPDLVPLSPAPQVGFSSSSP